MNNLNLKTLMKTQVLACLLWLALPHPGLSQPANYTNEAVVADYVKGMLYWPDAPSGAEQDIAAFRYKHLLYGSESNQIRARFETMPSLYGSSERSRSQTAEEYLRRGLTNNPASVVLGGLLLDIYYDRSVAESILAQQAMADADFVRFSSVPTTPPQLVVDGEIAAWLLALDQSRLAVTSYLGLLTNHLGLSADPATPKGYLVFQQLVPTRGLEPASYLNSNNVPVLVTDTGPLFTGYKDLVLLYDLLRDYGRAADALTRHYIGRGKSSDLAAAKALVTEVQRFIYLHGTLLQGAFPGLDPATVDPASGLAESEAAWEKVLSDLEVHRQYLEGKANLLGFAPNFLMLIGRQSTNFDSFDSYKLLLNPNDESSELKLAQDALQSARDNYAQYRGYEEELRDAFDAATGTAEDRLFEIVGARPGDAEYDTPQQGSEAWLQQQSILMAQLQIQRNQVEISNLKQQIQIEIDRRGQEQGINNAIATVQIEYGNKQADITEEIGHIEAAQALANAAADAVGAESPWGAGASAANGVAQAAAEEVKGQLNAKKERLAAQEEAKITSLNDQLLDVNSKTLIKNLWLQMNTLMVDSQEAALQLVQEQGRLAALAREKADLEATIAESDSTLSTRYFADPSHRLRLQADQVLADLHFAEAQKWLFFMLRALQYKWNEPFQQTYPSLGGWVWTTNSIFQVRNADELRTLYQAMVAFDNDRLSLFNNRADYFDWFSLRENFFGYTNGPSATYPDPITGQPTTAIGAFRSQMYLLTNINFGFITLEFSTVRQGGSAGSFFLGATYDPNDGSTNWLGNYLDKIQYLRINLPGSHPTNQTDVTAELRYGGISYIRNPHPAPYDPNRPDRLPNEWTSYSTRFWYKDGPDWRFSEAQRANIILTLSQNPRVPPSVHEIDAFAERSVAASRWTLLIPIQGNSKVDIENMDDVEIEFSHQAFTRQQ